MLWYTGAIVVRLNTEVDRIDVTNRSRLGIGAGGEWLQSKEDDL